MLVILFRLLSVLPLPALHRMGAALGWIVYWGSPSYRRRLRTNITLAGFLPDLPQAIRESGKSILELAFIWCAPPERVSACASVENWEVAQAALDTGRGVIFLTPHLGCFEIIAQSIALHTPLTVMYRPPRKAGLKPLIEGARARKNLLLAPANLAGVRILAKALKKSQPIGLLPDQVPQNGEGVWADFFGKAAYTMTLPAKLQQMTDATIILSYAERLGNGQGYVVRFVPFEEDLRGSLDQRTLAINAEMEKLISRCPSQYFWSYNRYKTPHDVATNPVVKTPPNNPLQDKT